MGSFEICYSAFMQSVAENLVAAALLLFSAAQ